MNTALKYAAALTVAGALALAVSTPSDARGGRNAAAAIGFGAGAVVGAAAATAYYGPGYYGPGPYGYRSGYAYGPDAYAYAPSMVRGYGMEGCATEGLNGHIDYFSC